jgi:hypothetical protein
MHMSLIMVRVSENGFDTAGIRGTDFPRMMGMLPSDVVLLGRESRGWDFAIRRRSRLLAENSNPSLEEIGEGKEV